MKYFLIIIIACYLTSCYTNIKKTENNIDLKKINIEWTGNIDKPIPKIIICTNCTDYKMILQKHQYKTSSKSLKEINSIFFKENKTEKEIKINEKNKKKYLSKLKDAVTILIKNNENDLLIEDIKTFISRLE